MGTRTSGRHRLGDYAITEECADELRAKRQQMVGSAVNTWNRRSLNRRHRSHIDDFLRAYPADLQSAIRERLETVAD